MSKPKPTPPSRLFDLPFSALPKFFKPLNDRVALRRHPKDHRPDPGSLLFRPASKLKNSDRATVLALGPRTPIMKAEGIKVGDVVVVSRFSDGDTYLRDGGDGERLMVIPEAEIMARVEEG